MKKKIMLIIVLSLLLVVLSNVVFILYKKNQKIALLKTTLEFEYGEIIQIDGPDLLDTLEPKILESFTLDSSVLEFEEGNNYPKVGNYELPLQYHLHGYEKDDVINIIVKDTLAPEFITFSDEIQMNQGFDINELSSYFTATDLSPIEINLDTETIDVDVPGEYEIEITAMDAYDNKNSRKAKVIILEEPEEIPNESTTPTPYTVSGPSYVGDVMIVNKKHPVPYNYAPYENAEAGNQLRSLISDMQNLGYNISNGYSGFRSFDTQAKLYQNYVNNYGSQQADTFSARPGYSEHQTGLAFDLLHGDGSLVVNEAEVNWIAENAHNYGFIVRYQVGKEHITGYQAEPWHLRYLGNLATDVYNSQLSLEEYFDVQGGSY